MLVLNPSRASRRFLHMAFAIVATCQVLVATEVVAQTATEPATATELPPLPQVVTSFGAAMVDGSLYVYGGHIGEAHEYMAGDQEKVLRRLDIARFEEDGSATWETLAESTPLQGLALVPHGNGVIRIGGFNAQHRTLASRSALDRRGRSLLAGNQSVDSPPLAPRATFQPRRGRARRQGVRRWRVGNGWARQHHVAQDRLES
ncbi:MAG: hypothetical protein R3B96_14940 [Pirellulaceae bacterium]